MKANNSSLDEFILMGFISRLFGILGWVRIKEENFGSIANYQKIFYLPVDRSQATNSNFSITHYNSLINNESYIRNINPDLLIEKKIIDVSYRSDKCYLKLDGVSNRDDATLLLGGIIFIKQSMLAKVDNINEYYYRDLIGMSVYNREAKLLGRISYLFDAGNSDIMVLDENETMIPFVDMYIDNIDLSKKTVLVDWQVDW